MKFIVIILSVAVIALVVELVNVHTEIDSVNEALMKESAKLELKARQTETNVDDLKRWSVDCANWCNAERDMRLRDAQVLTADVKRMTNILERAAMNKRKESQ